MIHKKIMSYKTLFVMIILVALNGCAASRSVVTLDQPSSTVVNPEQGTAIKITRVVDDRVFESAPKNPDTPSLPGDDVNNTSLKARAIGRKRSGFGMAMGDVLLPENQKVTEVIKESIANGFRESNYRVLSPGDTGYDKATPVEANVIQFWSWLQPGFWQLTIHNRAEVKITGSLQALKGGLTVTSSAAEPMMVATEDDWQNTSSEGLKKFSDNLVNALTGKPQNIE